MDMYDVGNKNFSPAMNKLWYCPPVRHGRASPGFVGSVPNDHFFSCSCPSFVWCLSRAMPWRCPCFIICERTRELNSAQRRIGTCWLELPNFEECSILYTVSRLDQRITLGL